MDCLQPAAVAVCLFDIKICKHCLCRMLEANFRHLPKRPVLVVQQASEIVTGHRVTPHVMIIQPVMNNDLTSFLRVKRLRTPRCKLGPAQVSFSDAGCHRHMPRRFPWRER